METEAILPVLTSDTDSLQIISALLPEFYRFIDGDSKIINLLLSLQRSGNKKAEEIICYLTGKIPSYTHFKRLYEEGNWREEYNTAYDLYWTDFMIANTTKGGAIVYFHFEALFENEMKEIVIKRHIIDARDPKVFRKEFLLKEVSEWVKSKGLKLRRSNPEKDAGMLHPYTKISYQFLNSKPSEKDPQNGWSNLTKHVRGRCTIELLPL